MAFRSLKLFRILRSASVIRHNAMSTFIAIPDEGKLAQRKEYKTETNIIYLEDPDTFGNLAGKSKIQTDSFKFEDEGDIKEQKFLENVPLRSHKLTIKQYADLIKQYLQHKRLKEAIDILEVRMLTQDRVKPENYIYNILIGACANVGYTKKAFKLYNDMKRRALKPTGDTYTCLFHACANSPWPSDGLKKAERLRELMKEKGIEPNLTNYNAMIKAFGRCGDLRSAFKIVDEMTANKMKIRVHTFNHLLHACIADKDTGLRHALVVWRKMLKLREKPNIYTFNLMLKCVKECNLGSKQEIEDLVTIIRDQALLQIDVKKPQVLQIESSEGNSAISHQEESSKSFNFKDSEETQLYNKSNVGMQAESCNKTDFSVHQTSKENNMLILNTEGNELAETVTIQFVDKLTKPGSKETRTLPNLLSKVINLQQVTSLQEVHTSQDKFAVIGGQEDFLKEMESFSVKPDIKIFTQMLPLLENTKEAEIKLLETMKSNGVRADIDFYNMLIKKRCLRTDYVGAFDVKELIEKEGKKRHPLNKKHKLKVNIMTYGVWAMACETKEKAEKLLNEMKEEQIKVNIEILGTLLRQGTSHNNFKYVQYIMDVVKEENVKVNDIFIKHLEAFNDKCARIAQDVDKNGQPKCPEWFPKVYKGFSRNYSQWLKDVNAEQALESEHPWKQFSENYPETIQRQNFEIVEPKRFYKRNRKYIKYAPRV